MKNNFYLVSLNIFIVLLFFGNYANSQDLEEIVIKVRKAYGDDKRGEINNIYEKFTISQVVTNEINPDMGTVKYQQSLDPSQGNYEKHGRILDYISYRIHKKGSKNIVAYRFLNKPISENIIFHDEVIHEESGQWVRGKKTSMEPQVLQESIDKIDLHEIHFDDISNYELSGIDIINQKKVYVILNKKLNKKYFIDSKTFFIIKETYTSFEFKDKKKVNIGFETTYSDFRKIGKYLFPFKEVEIKTTENDNNVITNTTIIFELKINEKIDPILFHIAK